MYRNVPILLRSVRPQRSLDFKGGYLSTVVQSIIDLRLQILFCWFLISLSRPLPAEDLDTANQLETKAPSSEQLEFFENAQQKLQKEFYTRQKLAKKLPSLQIMM